MAKFKNLRWLTKSSIHCHITDLCLQPQYRLSTETTRQIKFRQRSSFSPKIEPIFNSSYSKVSSPNLGWAGFLQYLKFSAFLAIFLWFRIISAILICPQFLACDLWDIDLFFVILAIYGIPRQNSGSGYQPYYRAKGLWKFPLIVAPNWDGWEALHRSDMRQT